jgi:hypothetical protein
MSGDEDDAKARAERARKNLKRRAKAVEFEAYEDAEMRREEQQRKVTPESRGQPRPTGPEGGHAGGRRKGLPSQRGK